MEYHLTTPLTRADLAPLRAGDAVLLSGTVYTARDAAHARLCELLKTGGEPPFPLEGSAVYYVGPTPERPGEVIGAAGPTTSGRMDRFSPMLIERGQRVMIGKGRRSAAVKDAIVRCGADRRESAPDRRDRQPRQRPLRQRAEGLSGLAVKQKTAVGARNTRSGCFFLCKIRGLRCSSLRAGRPAGRSRAATGRAGRS